MTTELSMHSAECWPLLFSFWFGTHDVKGSIFEATTHPCGERKEYLMKQRGQLTGRNTAHCTLASSSCKFNPSSVIKRKSFGKEEVHLRVKFNFRLVCRFVSAQGFICTDLYLGKHKPERPVSNVDTSAVLF